MCRSGKTIRMCVKPEKSKHKNAVPYKRNKAQNWFDEDEDKYV